MVSPSLLNSITSNFRSQDGVKAQAAQVLVADFDHTLFTYPEDVASSMPDMRARKGLSRISEQINSFVLPALERARMQGRLGVVVSSGNMREAVERRLDGRLKPEAMYLKVGTERFVWDEVQQSYTVDESFIRRMCSDFNVQDICCAVQDFAQVAGYEFTPHAESANGPGKFSGHIAFKSTQSRDAFVGNRSEATESKNILHNTMDDASALDGLNMSGQERLLQTLEKGNRVRLVISSIVDGLEIDDFAQRGYSADCVFNLDVLHADAGKDRVIDHLNIQDSAQIYAAGDGGNDSGAMLHPSVAGGVIPVNSKPDLVTDCAPALASGKIMHSKLPAGMALISYLSQKGVLNSDELVVEESFGELPARLQKIFIEEQGQV